MNNVTTEDIRKDMENFYLHSEKLFKQQLSSINRSIERRQMLLAKFQEKVQRTEMKEDTRQLIPVFNALMDVIQDFKTFLSSSAGGYDEVFVYKSPVKYLELEHLPQNLLLLEQQIRTNIAAINTIKPVFDTKIILKGFNNKITGLVNVLEAMIPILLYEFVLSFEVDVLEHLLLNFF